MPFLMKLRRRLEALPRTDAVVVVLGLLVTLPLWVVERPPLQDLPQHVAAVRVLSSYWEPGYRFGEYFELTLLRTQYLTVYLLAAGLAKFLGPLVATKVVLSASLVATPYCLLRLARAIGYGPGLSLLSLPLLFNVHVAYGFLNFVAGLPLLLWGLELAVLELRAPSRRRSLWLGAVLVLTFLTHVIPFGLLGLGVVLLTRLERPALLCRGVVLLPAALAALLWLVMSPAGRIVSALGASSSTGDTPPSYQRFGDALRQLPDWLIEITPGDTDDLRLSVWLGLWLALLVIATALPNAAAAEQEPLAGEDASRQEAVLRRARLVVGAVVPLALIGYATLPTSNGFIWPICQRFPLIAALFSVFLLGRLPKAAEWFGGVVCVVLALGSTAEQISLFRRVEAEAYGGFDDVVERIPLGSRVATLVYDRNVEGLRPTPLMHAAGWVQAARGGLVMFTFAEFPSSPFAYRSERRPPPVPPRWEWVPERVHPDRDLTWYDFVLVHGRSGTLQGSRAFVRVAEKGHWSLWRRADRGA